MTFCRLMTDSGFSKKALKTNKNETLEKKVKKILAHLTKKHYLCNAFRKRHHLVVMLLFLKAMFGM